MPLSNRQLKYTGEVQPAEGERDEDEQPMFPYLPDDDLKEAVNLAILLKRPLLVTGEPGCGKTRLARAVAYELKLRCLTWPVKSTSRAVDGRYLFDTIGRLRDAQLASSRHLKAEEREHILERVDDPSKYIRWGVLGKAFRSNEPTVVLIDEVDKADIDFPNDLLLELDERYFTVEETGEEIRAKEGAEPIVFITSNRERDLPDAFLRRCLYYHIPFPSQERLTEIVHLHFRDASEDLVNRAVDRFQKLRDRMVEDKGKVGKKVSTSELIDWFQVLETFSEDEAMKELEGKLPASVLLKNWDDHMEYKDFI